MYITVMIDGLVTGGAQQLQVTFAKEALKRGHKFSVVSLSLDDGSPYPEQLRKLGVPVYFFPTNRIFNFENIRRITQWVRSEKPDVIHAHLTYANILGAICGFLTRTPVISTLHNTGVENKFHAPRTEAVETFALRYIISKVIACGPAVARYAGTIIKNKPILCIPNAIGFSLQKFVPGERETLRKEIANDDRRLIIISVGRLVPQKSFEDLIDAFAIMHPSCPNAYLAIVGAGDLQDTLEEQIKNLGLSQHVRLLGKRTDVPRLLAVSDMFALASHWEGLPVAILEAMTAGLPVLATDVGDNAWAVGATGVIVPPKQPNIFANTMLALLDDPTRRLYLGQAAQARIQEVFNPSNWFDDIFSIYQSALHRS